MDQLVNYIKTKYEKNNNTISPAPILHHLLNTDTMEGDPIDPDAYTTAYKKLREWVTNALDVYKSDLSLLLYPIFVHSYLDLVNKNLLEQAKYFMNNFASDFHETKYTTDIDLLSKVTTQQSIDENIISRKYRNNKYHIPMSSISFDLFANFIQDNNWVHLINIVKYHLSIQFTHEKSAGGPNGILSGIPDGVGILEPEEDELMDDIKQENDITKMNDSISPIEKLKGIKQETLTDGIMMDDISMSPTVGVDIQAELDTLKDLRQRISIGSVTVPSICAYTFHNTRDSLNCITFSEDLSLVAGGFSESFIKVWSLKGEKLKKPNISKDHENKNELETDYVKLVGHSGPVYGTSFNHDNEYLLSCSQDQTVRLWNMNSYENSVVYKNHNYPVWDVDFGPFGFYFATASHDKTARLWTCDHIYPLRIFAGHLSDVDVVKFHPNSKYLVTGSSDKTARLWDVQRGTCVRVFTGHNGPIRTVAISPNGRLMASAGDDKTINLWDLGSGRRLKTMTGHSDNIYSVDFSVDSHTLISGSADGTVRVWDVNKDTASSSPNSISRTSELNMKRMRMEETARKDKKDKKIDDKRNTAGILESNDQLVVFPTKQTPIYTVKFTNRNLCLVAGVYNP
ncbi:unnamed protein product [Cunninghamella echinulata]